MVEAAGRRLRVAIRVKRHLGRPGKRRAHECERAEHIGTYQGAPRGDEGPIIVSDHRGGAAIAEREREPEHIAHRVQKAEGPQVRVVICAPAGRAAVAAQVRRDHMKAGSRDRRHHLAPRIGHLRKPVQHQNQRAVRTIETSLEDVHAQAVDAVDEPRTDTRRKHRLGERLHRLARALFAHRCVAPTSAMITSAMPATWTIVSVWPRTTTPRPAEITASA